MCVALDARSGRLKRHTLPFTWCGIVHERLSPIHYILHQAPYLLKLKTIQFTQQTSENESLCDVDCSQHRSLVMSLLWLCKTRGDLLTNVVLLQTEMHIPCGRHMKLANSVLKNAVTNRESNVLHFCGVGPLKTLAQITDSGHITQNTCYRIEGRMVILMPGSRELSTSSQEYYTGAETTERERSGL